MQFDDLKSTRRCKCKFPHRWPESTAGYQPRTTFTSISTCNCRNILRRIANIREFWPIPDWRLHNVLLQLKCRLLANLSFSLTRLRKQLYATKPWESTVLPGCKVYLHTPLLHDVSDFASLWKPKSDKIGTLVLQTDRRHILQPNCGNYRRIFPSDGIRIDNQHQKLRRGRRTRPKLLSFNLFLLQLHATSHTRVSLPMHPQEES